MILAAGPKVVASIYIWDYDCVFNVKLLFPFNINMLYSIRQCRLCLVKDETVAHEMLQAYSYVIMTL